MSIRPWTTNGSSRRAGLGVSHDERHVLLGERDVSLDERPLLQLVDGLLQLRLGVHHDWSVPGDRLFERAAGDEQEANPVIAGMDSDLVAAVEEHQRTVPYGIAAAGPALGADALRAHRARLGRIAEGT